MNLRRHLEPRILISNEFESPIFHGTVNSPEQEFVFWFEGEGRTAIKRLLGCAIMARLPEKGINEAVKSLKDIYDFYCEDIGDFEEKYTSITSDARFDEVSEEPELILSV
jgi:hypothetical protein